MSLDLVAILISNLRRKLEIVARKKKVSTIQHSTIVYLVCANCPLSSLSESLSCSRCGTAPATNATHSAVNDVSCCFALYTKVTAVDSQVKVTIVPVLKL